MTNDHSAYKSNVVGIWFYGVKDVKSIYVWTCLARFVFNRNFK